MRKVNRVLILDTETDGVDPKINKCIEVACCLYDIKNLAPIESFASLIKGEGNDAEKINGISPKILSLCSDANDVWHHVKKLALATDSYLAHNAQFDEGFTPESIRTINPWVCSMSDFEYPCFSNSKSLVAIALAHGVGVVHAHRAMSDVDTLSRLLTRLGEMGCNLEEMFQRGMRPKSLYEALVSFHQKDKAKNAGFGWDADNKRWTRKMADEDVSKLDFKVKRIDG